VVPGDPEGGAEPSKGLALIVGRSLESSEVIDGRSQGRGDLFRS
jgi:hypothetical protein